MRSFLVSAHVAWLVEKPPSKAFDATVLESNCDDIDAGLFRAAFATRNGKRTRDIMDKKCSAAGNANELEDTYLERIRQSAS